MEMGGLDFGEVGQATFPLHDILTVFSKNNEHDRKSKAYSLHQVEEWK